MKKRMVRIWVSLGILALLLVMLLAFLQTPPGKTLLASVLSRSLSRQENLDVRVGKISGWIPVAIEIDRVEIGDADGVWLSADGLQCRWIFRELLHRRIRLARLGAKRIEWHRFPAAGPSRSSSVEPRAFDPVEIVLNKLSIEQLKLEQPVAGVSLQYVVSSGGIRMDPSGQLTGRLRVSGDADGQVEFDAVLGNGLEHRLTIQAGLDRMTHPSFGLDLVSGQAEATLTRAGVTGSVAALIRKDDLECRLSTRLNYTRGQLQVPYFEVAAGGVSAAGNLALNFSGNTTEVLMNARVTDAATNNHVLHADATVSSNKGHWTVNFHPLEFRFLELIHIALSGEISRDRLALKGMMEEFDLNALPIAGLAHVTGGTSGTFSLSGSMAQPEIGVELDVAGLTSTQEALDELPELNLHVSGGLANGYLQGATAITNSISGRMAAGFRMPCAFSLDPFRFKPDVNAIRGDLSADVQLDILNRLALFNDQRMAGRLEAELVYDQKLSGILRLEHGMYEHFRWGVVVRDIALDLRTTGEGLRINTATATDGADGRITLTGGMASNQWDLTLDMARAAIVRRDDVDGMLSGRLALAGPLAHPQITGVLSVDRADILIDNFAPALPPLLTDYDALAIAEAEGIVQKKAPLPFDLDVQVDLADQVYANASMIDSIWGGNLRIRNLPQGLSVIGAVKPQRGYVSFIGKKFRFTDGQIDLDGGVPAAPSMNQITAEYSRGDFTARLILNGRFDNPRFRLESTPAMPQDEVLSHVLFERDTSEISPYQAFQLAAAARQLSGGLSGPGFMYQMRQVVGIDTLEWRESDVAGGASSVAAGKYLTPALYIEINRSLDEKGDAGMMAEYEVTKHFSVETSTGPKMRPGIGVNWKNDY